MLLNGLRGKARGNFCETSLDTAGRPRLPVIHGKRTQDFAFP